LGHDPEETMKFFPPPDGCTPLHSRAPVLRARPVQVHRRNGNREMIQLPEAIAVSAKKWGGGWRT